MWPGREATLFDVHIISFLRTVYDANIKLASYTKSITAYHQINNNISWFNLWQWKENRRKKNKEHFLSQVIP